ncbi:MAG: alkaline phosphatase family protein [Anaerolineae bacterium]|nr:alkaline phosphatase family protein [Anaerolineae bacterium]
MMRLFRRPPPRVLVIGLDCASPELVFSQFRDDLPVLSRLMQAGTWGVLRSSIPCITVPAWASMMSSRDPGVLGVYGFRNRAAWDYASLTTADSRAMTVPRLWDILSQAGKECLLLNVPQTYPVQPLKGHAVGCFLTPGTDSAFAYPALFRQEVLKVAPNYHFDVHDFRTEDKDALLQRIIDLTEVQYRLLEHALTTKPWDFAMHVNMGVDRIHHGFWRYHDPKHRLHEPGSRYQHAIRDYYRLVDAWIGRLLERAGDNVAVLVVSDHGVKRMDGAIAINEWLWRNGWLALHTPPTPGRVQKWDAQQVDWSRTRAWSTGGYYGRIFLNVQGREPQGIIPAADYAAVRETLAAQLQAIPGAQGEALATQVFTPQAIYRQVNGCAPDLIVYFGDLHWRTVGSLGYGQHFTLENDTGPDDANHAEEGLFLLVEPGRSGAGASADRGLMDIAPTLLQRLGVPVPADMQGRALP